MPFAIPMVWRKGNDHITDSYFYKIKLKGFNRKIKHLVQYSDVPSAHPSFLDLPVTESDGIIEYSSYSQHRDMTGGADVDAYKPEEDDQSVPLT